MKCENMIKGFWGWGKCGGHMYTIPAWHPSAVAYKCPKCGNEVTYDWC